MLNIPEFTVIKQEQNEHFYRFTVEKKELPFMCTNCGVDLTTLSKLLEEGDF